MKKGFITGLLILFICAAHSQNSKLHKISFSSINQVGVVTGADRDAPIIQTINGLSYKSWSAGIGIGIDTYSERSVPLFFDARKSFGKGDNKPFAYADAGVNFGWLNFIQREEQSFPEYDQPLMYYDAGIGWNIPIGSKTGFIISAGYSIKQLGGERVAYGPMIGGQLHEYKEKFENTYRRIIIKFGVHL
jgi:hypothetical protein